MALKPGETTQLQAFLGAMMAGAAELSFKAMPLITLYNKAKAENLDFWELLLTDESASRQLTQAMEKHVEKMPPALFASMKLLCNARQQLDLRKKQEAASMAAAKARHKADARAEAGSTVGGNRVEEV